jgi:photosystem II stability/assembly factor-like uncharacterized protein
VVGADTGLTNRVYAAARRDVYVSVDGGVHFAALPARLYDSPPDGCCERPASLAILRGEDEAISFPLRQPQLIVGTYQGVYYSSDGGQTFAEGLYAEDHTAVQGPLFIVPAPGGRDIAYVWDWGGPNLATTSDGGATWHRIPPPYFSGAPQVAVLDAPGDTLLLAGIEGVFRSVDAGATWTPVANGLPPPPYRYATLGAGDPAHVGRAFIVVSGQGTYRSDDGGGTWIRVGPASPDLGQGVSVIPRDDVLWFNAGQFLSRSLDGGQSWTIVFRDEVSIDMALDATSSRIYTARTSATGNADPGVWFSDDQGLTWQPSLAGLTNSAIDFALSDAGGTIYAKVTDKLYARDDGGQAWRDITPPLKYGFDLAYPPEDILVLGRGSLLVRGAGSDLYRTDDAGTNWRSAGSSAVSLIAAEPGQPDVIYGRDYVYGCGIYCITQTHVQKSIDTGLTWTSINAGLPAITSRLLALGEGRLFAATSDGYWSSSNGGEQWNRTFWQSPPGTVRSVAPDPADSATVYALTDHGLFGSDNAGASFALVGPLPDPDAFFAAVAADATHTIYVATKEPTQPGAQPPPPDAQVYASDNGGMTWRAVGAPLADYAQVTDLLVSPISPSTLYAMSDRGVLELVARTDVARAVEFYHSDFDHYFVSANADEIAMLNLGSLPPWVPTGESWPVFDAQNLVSSPVCRFFSASFAPKSSHFYTPFPAECATVKANPGWQFEGIAFYVQLPTGYGTGNGYCSQGAIALYRAYNNGMGGAPNHRYTTSIATLNAMLAQGWTFEGEANTKVFACVPQ